MTTLDIKAAHEEAIKAHQRVARLQREIVKAREARSRAFARFAALGGETKALGDELGLSKSMTTLIKKGQR